MAAGIARQKGFALIDSFTVDRIDAMERTIRFGTNPDHINEFVTANFISPYLLFGLSAEKYPPNLYTDVTVNYLISQARPDGGFLTESGRPPLETGEIHLAAMSIHAIQLYASPAKKDQVNNLVARSKQWLENAAPKDQQELAFQLLGLQWCNSSMEKKIKVAEKLKLMQNADGGWSQVPTLKSDALRLLGQTFVCIVRERRNEARRRSVPERVLGYLLR